MPDGATVLLGGLRVSDKKDYRSGVPIVNKIPLLSMIFERKGKYVANKKLLILLAVAIRASASVRIPWPGSEEGVAPWMLVLLVTVARVRLEERALAEGLPGYAEYQTRTRFRLVPGVW